MTSATTISPEWNVFSVHQRGVCVYYFTFIKSFLSETD
jgi:hypothetical protein